MNSRQRAMAPPVDVAPLTINRDGEWTIFDGRLGEVGPLARARVTSFAPGEGFVSIPVRNVQPQTPVENLLAMYAALREVGRYHV